MIKKLLIANRGEIACRIILTAKRMGISTVAVYSQADETALHVRRADSAYLIGPADASESYLNIEAILEAAKQSGADAIHPGYGFLAESGPFAEAVRKAGLIFVGPPTDAIHAMGAKDNAKALMAAAGVPLISGYYGADQSTERLTREATAIGYPVLLKAALGGGGKGMRIVHSEPDLKPAVESAKREALASFGDDRLLIERYLADTRHVELQIFADSHGNVVHLFERDCSLQRRHQKVIEEAPAPGLTDDLRQRMGASAIAAAKAVKYEGAGTVEFLLAPDNDYYFMEMNTRLQVEHPVSELITGLDFVEWQLRIAVGEVLPLRQNQILMTGHAVEVRLYAEDPTKGFLPAPGTIRHLRWPQKSQNLRIDTGVEEGDVVSPHYDPMIAKIISYGENRNQAISHLVRALADLEIAGPGHNIGFLLQLLNSTPFRKGDANTSYVDQLPSNTMEISVDQINHSLAAATRYLFETMDEASRQKTNASNDPFTPWQTSQGWRLSGAEPRRLTLTVEDEEYSVRHYNTSDGPAFEINGEVIFRDSVASARVFESKGTLHVLGISGPVQVKWVDPLETWSSAGAGEKPFSTPMPGKITAVNVKKGDAVAKGEVLIVLEAMKMEHSITAPRDGVIESLFVSVNQQVEEGVELLVMELKE